MRVRRLDDSTYVVYYDDDLFRAYHSDVAETPFATVRDLNSSDRKYAYVIWKLSGDGKNLRLRNVNDKVVPKETRDSATVVALLTKMRAILSCSAKRSSLGKRNSRVEISHRTGSRL
jgi:hypothetical protein